jgi:hypothetical protein
MSPAHASAAEPEGETRAQLFALCHAFLAEPWNCEVMTQVLLAGCPDPSDPVVLYRDVVRIFSNLQSLVLPLPGCSPEANFAWLLRDLAGLPYADIAAVLEVPVPAVRQTLADVRTVALATVLAA